MSKKTNKTSHVMDLLTNGTSSDPNDSSAASAQDKKSDAPSHAAAPKKVTVVDEGSINDRLSQEILNKLSEELKEEETQAGQAAPGTASQAPDTPDVSEAMQETAPQSAAKEDDRDAQETQAGVSQAQEAVSDAAEEPSEAIQTEAHVPAQDPVQTEAPQPAPVSPQAIIPKSQISNRLLNHEYHFVNVMEQLILRQNMDSYLEQYNVCKCARCMADVCALTLTGLPSKYVVTSKDSLSPLLSYYESKYKIYMLTEIIKACNRVRENPRHEKES